MIADRNDWYAQQPWSKETDAELSRLVAIGAIATGEIEPYEKQRLVMCPCCATWLMKGSLGPKGCPTCGGAL